MRVMGFPAGMFQTNCYVVALDDRAECVVIDPGQEALEPLKQVFSQHSCEPVAVLLTHGHLDHTWTAQPLCDEYGIPAFIHPDDREMLATPSAGLGPQLSGFVQDSDFTEPGTVKDLTDGEKIELAGIEFAIDHTPGHTRGSVVARVQVETGEGPRQIAFTGDTLFAGSVGRSDLPGGSHEQLLASIADKLLPLGDDTMILPGHGDTSTIGRERAANPFLQDIR
ncbi:MBL fold metallo-hydrolase [Hoyosella subflava]|uniref:Metallo-beta-lactamase superfamily protein n=1 Tax=Hoyosella subflava (strain DSM 45089 / JCM 17490 / NBRC 109087 / DQS3-9A1) TaxID=443218 RepID=F6ELM4_HOYSD|nr:MBL fold metallo-hydrolase [Hoyosella subflava]AEF40274.1 Metallo-beta-lactamase superfamily protein [Hoyosella subflava DQS3-9A1]